MLQLENFLHVSLTHGKHVKASFNQSYIYMSLRDIYRFSEIFPHRFLDSMKNISDAVVSILTSCKDASKSKILLASNLCDSLCVDSKSIPVK